jgi:hypothetical protein
MMSSRICLLLKNGSIRHRESLLANPLGLLDDDVPSRQTPQFPKLVGRAPAVAHDHWRVVLGQEALQHARPRPSLTLSLIPEAHQSENSLAWAELFA